MINSVIPGLFMLDFSHGPDRVDDSQRSLRPCVVWAALFDGQPRRTSTVGDDSRVRYQPAADRYVGNNFTSRAENCWRRRLYLERTACGAISCDAQARAVRYLRDRRRA